MATSYANDVPQSNEGEEGQEMEANMQHLRRHLLASRSDASPPAWQGALDVLRLQLPHARQIMQRCRAARMKVSLHAHG